MAGPGLRESRAVAEPKALTRAERSLAVVQRADEHLRRKTAETMSYQADAADLDDNGAPVDPKVVMVEGRPAGWSPRRYNVAKDSRRPEREQPGYLARATRVFESYKRKEEVSNAPPLMNVAVQINITSPAAKEALERVKAKYEIIDVDETGEKQG